MNELIPLMSCQWCGKEFVFRSRMMKRTRKFCSTVCQGLAIRRTPEQKFARYALKTGTCWLWTGAIIKSTGYGAFNIGAPHYHTRTAHRVSYEMHVGPIPPGMFVCHSCDNRRCVNPEHLFLGTAADNSADMVAKGRQDKAAKAIGSRHGRAKLTEGQVIAIRHSSDSQKTLASHYCVSTNTIDRIRNRRMWRHVS